MSRIKSLVTEVQDYYDRLNYAQQSPMTKEDLAKYETEYALLQARYTSLAQSNSFPNTYE